MELIGVLGLRGMRGGGPVRQSWWKGWPQAIQDRTSGFRTSLLRWPSAEARGAPSQWRFRLINCVLRGTAVVEGGDLRIRHVLAMQRSAGIGYGRWARE